MKREEARQKLIDGTIHVIADEGLDKATTKLVGQYTDINQVYIYRCFKSKDDMFAKMFDVLDNQLLHTVTQNIDIMYMTGIEFKVRCKVFFFKLWSFLLANRENCLSYVRYYYSPYFKTYSEAIHKQRFWPVVEQFRGVFIDEADVWMIINYILNVMLDFAIKVHQGEMSEDDDYAEHVYRVIYAAVKQYFKNEKERNS